MSPGAEDLFLDPFVLFEIGRVEGMLYSSPVEAFVREVRDILGEELQKPLGVFKLKVQQLSHRT